MKKYLLIGILVLAAVLRLWRLGEFPALNADEAAIGYNAYSLIQTGKDEHANSWPIHFQSFNDYKPGLYFYLVLPFVKLFGLNIWSIRIPGALLGVATVYLVYLLVKEMFLGSKFKIGNWKLEILAAAMLTISPWHIHFSRGGWEVSAATFFITLGLWLFLKALKNPKYYWLSALSLLLSLYTYHAARIVVPILGLSLLIIYWKQVKKNLKPAIMAVVLAGVLLLPLAIDLVRSDTFSRAAGVGLFADTGPLSRINEQRGEHTDFTGVISKIFHNKATNYGLAFLQNWGQHFWGEFLFLSGDDIQRNKVPETGQMHLFEIITVVVGLVGIVGSLVSPSSKDRTRKSWRIILVWLLVAPVASALTFQSPHALRAHNMVIPLTIISAYGLVLIVKWLGRLKNWRVVGFSLVGVLIVWSFVRYLHMYWVHMAKEYPFSSQYGVEELVNYLQENQERYERIVVTDRYDQPYILFLFYLKYPPEKFQLEHSLTSRDEFGFSTVREFGKYRFESIDFENTRVEYPGALIVGTDEEIPEETNIVKDIYGTNDYLYFQIVAN